MRPRTWLEWFLEAVSLLGLVFPFGVTVSFWSILPERIPIHFNFEGQPDGWGSRTMMLAIPMSNLVSYVILTAIGTQVKTMAGMNVPKGVDRDHPEVKHLARELLSWVKAMVAVLMSYLTWGKAQVALERATTLPTLVPIAVTVLIPILAVVYTQRMRRYRLDMSEI